MIMETIKQIGTEATISDILNANVELYFTAKVAFLLRQLTESGKLQRIEHDGKAYYSIK